MVITVVHLQEAISQTQTDDESVDVTTALLTIHRSVARLALLNYGNAVVVVYIGVY